MKRLILLGGGHSHVEVLRRFGTDPAPDTELVLMSPYPDAPYSGMLPGWIAGHYARGECHVDLVALARFANARFVQTACTGIDLDAQRAFGEDGAMLPYDVLSIDTGGGSPASATPGADLHALSVKPIERFMPRWDDLCDRVAVGPLTGGIVVVGGGAGGVESLLAMQHRLRAIAPASAVRFALVHETGNILPSHNDRVRAIFMRVLAERGVTLHLGSRVLRVESGGVELARGGSVAAGAIVWATGAAAPAWPGASGLATDGHGFVRVNARLQSVSHPQVFAAGDIASVEDHPRPKSGVYAVRAGPPLAKNLRRALRGRPLADWAPQKDALALIGTGDRCAVASRGPLALEGKWIWRWKDRIDRKFMARYRIP